MMTITVFQFIGRGDEVYLPGRGVIGSPEELPCLCLLEVSIDISAR
jgi:hypothetical protein